MPTTSVHSEQHANSYYAATANHAQNLPTLQGEIKVDVCIVGGGFSGLNSAIELSRKGFSVAVVEARQIGWGASGRNGGQLIRGIGHGVEQFEKHIGSEGVRQIKLMGLEAVDLVRQRVTEFSIDCDLRWGYCDLANKPEHLQGFAQDKAELESLGYTHELRLLAADEVNQVVASKLYCGGMIDMGSGHLHPLNLALGEADAALALGVQLFERSPVTRIDTGREIKVHTAQGQVRANTMILACNAYINDLEPNLGAKVLPAGSYVIATEPLGEARAQALIPQHMALCDQRVELDYYRLSADNRLLFGGACHYSGRDPADIAAYMRPKMLKVFPQLADVRIDYQWGGMIGIGANRLPQIGRLQDHANIYYAQAYAGHGVNATHMAGKLLAQAIAGEVGGFEIFNKVPHMTFPGGKHLRSPLLAVGMSWYRLKEALGLL